MPLNLPSNLASLARRWHACQVGMHHLHGFRPRGALYGHWQWLWSSVFFPFESSMVQYGLVISSGIADFEENDGHVTCPFLRDMSFPGCFEYDFTVKSGCFQRFRPAAVSGESYGCWTTVRLRRCCRRTSFPPADRW